VLRVAGDRDKPTYDELLERLVKLEKKTLGLKDLPMRSIQDSLEVDWQPNAGLLLPPGSITTALLAALAVGTDQLADTAVTPAKLSAAFGGITAIRWGVDSWTWPGVATVESGTRVVTHGLGTTPEGVWIQPAASGRGLGTQVSPVGATTFSTQARADSALVSVSLNFYWLAIA
jgi:hypothetical protein